MSAAMSGAIARVSAFCAIFALLFTANPAFAADEAVALHVRAAKLAREGQCAAALPILERVRTLAPDAAHSALLQGQCLFQAQDYAGSIPPLTDAARLDPNSGEAALLLGMASYHVGDFASATVALDRAETLTPDRAEVSLYRGLVLLEDDPDAAASRFESAARHGGVLEPAARYYAGVARADAGQREQAEAHLLRVEELAPGSSWATRADEALNAPVAQYRLRRWATLYAGVDYDSNVVLRGNGISLPTNVSNEDDGLAWWGVDAGQELFRRGKWGGGILGSYYGSAHFGDADYDQHLISASLWIDRTLGERSLLRISPEFGWGFFDYDSFVRYYGVLVEVLHDWGRPGQGTFYTRYSYQDYRYEIPGGPAAAAIRNRDGQRIRTGYDHRYTIDDKTSVRGGPFFRYYAAKGSEYDYWGAGAWAGVERQLPWELTLDLLGSVGYDDYRNASSYFVNTKDRSDVISMGQVALSRLIYDRTTLTGRYRYQDNHSNTNVFNYDRHVVGAYITVALGD